MTQVEGLCHARPNRLVEHDLFRKPLHTPDQVRGRLFRDHALEVDAMVHSTQPAHSHMHDHEGHVAAVEADLEYWRTKRLEPRVLQLHRRGVVTLYDLVRAAAQLPMTPTPAGAATHDSEGRIRALEDGLDEYIRGVALASLDSPDYPFVIEDTRKERGDYDDFFRIAKPPHDGTLEQRIARLEHELREYQRLLQVLMHALLAKGVLTAEQVEQQRAFLAGRGAWNGARIVARAWVDPAFKQALLARGREAVRELNIPPGRLGKLGVAENTATLHNVVVCTLCSCYPHDLLGDPPWWYRDDSYKTRIVRDPRGTLADRFDLRLPDGVEVRVHDSTSDVRWMVLPRRPAGTDGWSEEQLARLVTIDSLVGTAPALDPAALARSERRAPE
jgi:nitrile hydratase